MNLELLELFEQCESANGTNNKKKFIRGMLNAHFNDVMIIFNIVFDRQFKFGISQTNLMKCVEADSLVGYTDLGHWIDNNFDHGLDSIDVFNGHIQNIKSVSGNKQINYIAKLIDNKAVIEVKWFIRILLKNLKLGINKTVINKILVDEFDEKPIDEFPVQLCSGIKKVEDAKDLILPCIGQTKYDGTRIIAFLNAGRVTLKSRANKDCTHQFPEIVFELGEFAIVNKLEDCEFDGEIISKDFNSLQQRLGRKVENIVEDKHIKYMIYDVRKINSEDIRETNYERRMDIMYKLTSVNRIEFAESIRLNSIESINSFYKLNVDRGEEGIILKNIESKYCSNISDDRKGQWKYKPVIENTFEIVELLLGTGKNSALFSRFKVKDKSGKVIALVGSGTSNKDIEIMNEDDFNCKFIDVEYGEITNTDKGKSLRWPRFLKFRWDKEEADEL